MERMKRIVSLMLCFVMVIALVPANVFAAETDATLTAALNEAQAYIHSITLNNTSNDPEKVVKTFGTHFTWDNEKREGQKDYLFDWSYYNGVVFEGIEYLYEVTRDEQYKDYVMEYMSSLIASNGTWAKCTNSGYTSKECAGYNSTHGADCYKTASLLLDAYAMSGDDRYLKMANTLYADLDTAAENSTYNLSNCGNNYRHTWASDPSPDLWLDGLYMILPFRAEYAKHIGDTAELDLIVSRMQWVSDNMYNSSKKLFYHAADSATSNSKTYWLRSIGWYAAAIVDVMDSMEGQNLETMKTQLKKLVDGMKACQNTSNGMWLNNMAAAQSSDNPYETSGTALVCYAVMKAVNNGWLDESYADMAILAFKGICNEKLSNNNLTDICFKGAPGSSNSTFYDNEGKGLGPFIMFYAEMLEYVNKPEEEPEETVPETTVPETSVPTEPTVPETSAPVETEPETFDSLTDETTGVKVDSENITGLIVDDVEPALVADRVAEVLTGTLVAYDIFVEGFNSGTADVTIAIPAGVNIDRFAVFYLPDVGEPKRMPGSASDDGKTYTFTTTHFSTYVGGELATASEEPEVPATSVTDTGKLPGGTSVRYELVNTLTDGKQYLIVSRNTAGDGTALGTNTTGQTVTVETGNIINNKGNAAEWTATGSGTSWNFYNGSGYLGHNSSSFLGSYSYTLAPNAGSAVNWTVSGSNVKINLKTQDGWFGSSATYADFYLKSGNTWTMATGTSGANVYFYQKKTETLSGATVTFTVTPGAQTLWVNGTAALVPTVTLTDGTAVTDYEIVWASEDPGDDTVDATVVATVDANGKVTGKVTGVDDGTATITATLNKVNGTALVEPIVLKIPVTVHDIASTQWTKADSYTTLVNREPDFSDVFLTLTYTNDETRTVGYEEITFSGYDKSVVGEQTVTASYVDPNTGKTVSTTFDLDVKAVVIDGEPVWTVGEGYTTTVGHKKTFSDVSLSLTYSDGTTVTVAAKDITFSYTDAVGTQTVTASYDDPVTGETLTETFELEVRAKVQSGSKLSGKREFEFVENSTPGFAGLRYTVNYTCGCSEEINYTDLTVTGYDITTPGVYENCPVSYNGAQVGTVKVTVTERTDVTGSGTLQGGVVYKLATALENGKTYLLVNTGSGNGFALTNNNGSVNSTAIYSDNGTITVTSDANIAFTWSASDSDTGSFQNGNHYLYPADQSLKLENSRKTMEHSAVSGNLVCLYNTGSAWIVLTRYTYIQYASATDWVNDTTNSKNVGSVYLYEKVGNVTGGTVDFTVSPGEVALRPGNTETLLATVELNGLSVKLSDCTIEWTSADAKIATVSGGVVTGVKDGTTTITAKLTEVQGNALSTPITLSIPVTVKTKSVSYIDLSHAEGTVIEGSGNDVMTGGTIRIDFDDGSYELVNVTVGMLKGQFDVKTPGTYEGLKVVYNGEEYSGFTLHVTAKPDDNYPVYPAPGSVMVDKYLSDQSQFQDTGVAQVDLSTAALPIKVGTDVILVTDLSNSMAWEIGATKDDDNSWDERNPTDQPGNAKGTIQFERSKLYALETAIADFAKILLGDTTVGNSVVSQNTISMVTFGGYDKEYSADYDKEKYGELEDVTRTLILAEKNAQNIIDTVEDIVLVYDISTKPNSTTKVYPSEYKLSFDGGKTFVQNYGNTNYDYAFMETYAAVNALKEKYQQENGIPYSESGRKIQIIFMTDGAPTNYDGVYFNYNTDTTRPDLNAQWKNESKNVVKYSYGTKNSSGKMAAYGVADWYKHIAGSAYDKDKESITGNPLYWADQVADLADVAQIFSVGFDLANGGFSNMTFTEASGYPLEKVLEKLVTGQTLEVYTAANEADLTQIYNDLANEIVTLAATNAYFLDQMGPNFDIQMASTVTKYKSSETITLTPAPKITVTTYDVYDADQGLLAGKRIDGTMKTIETVTFNDAGTQAYSTVKDANGNDQTSGNILTDGVICAKNFWYNTTNQDKTITLADGTKYTLPGETFYWNIGTINKMEYVLSYPVYLTGASEGTAVEGPHDTNTHADLHYINWKGNDCEKSVPTPILPWQTAAVYYGFYLVNSQGQPIVNAITGETGSFAEAVRVTPKMLYTLLHLNEQAEFEDQNLAADVLPYGYELFDPLASYTIKIDSDSTTTGESGWLVGYDPNLTNAAGEPILTTYVTDYRGSEYTTEINSEKMDQHGLSYYGTTVWFAVEYSLSTVPDVVVIDYGLSVDVDVLANDMFGDQAVLNAVGATSKVPVRNWSNFMASPSKDFADSVTSDAYSDDLLTAGDVSVHNGEVRYTPNKMEMPTFDRVIYEAKFTNTVVGAVQYFYGELTVIPATIIYYEDDFLTYESFHVDPTTYALIPFEEGETGLWYPVGETIQGATQSEDRPGEYYFEGLDANNIYGYDPTYGDLATYSLGGAMQATVDASRSAVATFSFYGTGFDVISLTDCDAGAIFVDIFQIDENGAETEYHNYVVDNYYGYVLNHYKQTYTYNAEEGWVITAQSVCTEGDYEAGYKVIPTEIPGEGEPTEVTVYKRIYEIDKDAKNNAMYQVPVMKVVDMPYGHYRVSIRAAFKNMMYHNQNKDAYNETGVKSYNFTLDAIRIYDPANDGETDLSGLIEYAYGKDGEGWPVFFELRNQLLNSGSFDDGDKVNGAVFIDGNSSIDNDYIMTDYLNFGPNNEVYLANDQAVAFKLDLSGFVKNGKSIVADVHMALKTENGQDVDYEIYYLDENGEATDVRSYHLDTATDRYYKLPNYDKGVLVIRNNSDKAGALLSITNLKITFTENPYALSVGEELEIPMTITEEEMDMAVMSLRMRAMAPVVPEEPVPDESIPEESAPEESVPEESIPEETVPEEPATKAFDPYLFLVVLNKYTAKAGQKVKAEVITSSDVSYVVINGEKVTSYKSLCFGCIRVWSGTVTVSGDKKMEFETVAYRNDGLASEPITSVVALLKSGK